MKSLTKEKRYDLIDSFNSTSGYLDDLLNIDNITLNIWLTEYIQLNNYMEGSGSATIK